VLDCIPTTQLSDTEFVTGVLSIKTTRREADSTRPSKGGMKPGVGRHVWELRSKSGAFFSGAGICVRGSI